MILQMLMELFLVVADWIWSIVKLPECPRVVITICEQVTSVFGSAVGLSACFIDYRVASPLMVAVLALMVADWTYKLIIWILRKIPLAGMS